MEHYIIAGCDLHDENMVVRAAYQRETATERTFDNTIAGRRRMRAWLEELSKQHGNARVVFAYEASCLGFGLYDELTETGMSCYVLAPTKIETSVKQRKQKSDPKDAQKVLEVLRGHLLAGNALPSVWIPDHETRDDRELVRMRLRIGAQLSQVKAQIRSLLKRNSLVPAEGISAWTKNYRVWLKRLASARATRLGCGSRAALGSLLRQLQDQEREQNRLDSRVEALARSPRYCEWVAELESQPGVGLLTAMVFLTELGDPKRFKNRRELAAFLGLVPVSHESGKASDRKGHITRQGPARVRKVLCQAVWSALRVDCSGTRWYYDYVSRHPKRKKVAVVAAMRRLAIRLWHNVRTVSDRPRPGASVADSTGDPCPRAGVLIAAPCTPG